MADPLGLIGNTGGVQPTLRPPGVGPSTPQGGPSFKEMLSGEIEQVNRLQQESKEAIEDLAAGRRDDLESVMVATQKADTAFRMLLQVRNKVMDAYEEVKQMRV
jgi:flagellar hook-basal body complex protein FliE